MSNPWRRFKALNPDTEVWWDSSPLVWPGFKESYLKNVSDGDRDWFLQETGSMFLGDTPVDDWLFDGCTTNPPLSWAVLKSAPAEWDQIILEKRKAYSGRSKYGLFIEVYKEVVKRGAEKFLPLFEASDGKFGHISGQVDPQLMHNGPRMKEMAEELADLAPNVMIKIPGSTDGIPVFKHLASKGIATNATTVFTLPQIMAVARNVAEGRKLHLSGPSKPRKGWRAVCTHMAGRLEDSAAFRGYVNRMNLDISPLELRYASEAVVKKAAKLFVDRDLPIKMLVCSARKHHDSRNEVFYPHIDMFAGAPIVNTVPGKVFGDVMMAYRDREIPDNWDREVPDDKIDKLSQVPYFQQAYHEYGFHVEQFDEIPSLIENEADFVGAAKEMIAYVGSFL